MEGKVLCTFITLSLYFEIKKKSYIDDNLGKDFEQDLVDTTIKA